MSDTFKDYSIKLQDFAVKHRAVVIIAALSIVILVQFVFRGEFLEFLKIILSPQLVVGAFAVFFVLFLIVYDSGGAITEAESRKRIAGAWNRSTARYWD
jgi:hypothetical protein